MDYLAIQDHRDRMAPKASKDRLARLASAGLKAILATKECAVSKVSPVILATKDQKAKTAKLESSAGQAKTENQANRE